MSSTETSGAAPAEAAATTPAPSASVSFGSSRGSGLSRGKRPAPSGPTKASAPASDYKPTAIEVVQAPREYQNPFAPSSPEPVERAAEAPAPAASLEAAPVAAPAPQELFPLEGAPTAKVEASEVSKAELNILEPAQPKAAPAQTWESAGFKDDVSDRLAQAESAAGGAPDGEFDASSIPSQFLYVRPGVKFVPTPRNWGSSAPRERRGDARREEAAKLSDSAPAREHAAPESPGFFGWLKSLFGGSKPAAKGGEHRSGEHRHHRHRGEHGDSSHSEHGGEHRDRGGRRRRGGRDRGHRRHGEPQGSRQGGSI